RPGRGGGRLVPDARGRRGGAGRRQGRGERTGEALAGTWSWFDEVVGPALEAGPDGLITDDLAYVAPWGFDPVRIAAPLLLLHGGQDRIAPAAHSRWLADRCPTAELRVRPADGHISVLDGGAEALEWLAALRG
ncbi:hypothetical protein AB0O63_29510, partial [Streptomyces cyaneofuscatus]|uniref:alpha/beta fold hydrolase n=1 Tax=Streptomyces cyaneofuscatus TaxID=66883 RepID=UPI0034827FCB